MQLKCKIWGLAHLTESLGALTIVTEVMMPGIPSKSWSPILSPQLFYGGSRMVKRDAIADFTKFPPLPPISVDSKHSFQGFVSLQTLKSREKSESPPYGPCGSILTPLKL